MHELSIAQALVEQVERVRAAEGAAAVVSITLGLGALAGVDREALAFAFPLVAENTPLAGAKLVFEEVPAELVCEACGRRAPAERPAPQCPSCGSGRVLFAAGRDLVLRSVEVRVESEP